MTFRNDQDLISRLLWRINVADTDHCQNRSLPRSSCCIIPDLLVTQNLLMQNPLTYSFGFNSRRVESLWFATWTWNFCSKPSSICERVYPSCHKEGKTRVGRAVAAGAPKWSKHAIPERQWQQNRLGVGRRSDLKGNDFPNHPSSVPQQQDETTAPVEGRHQLQANILFRNLIYKLHYLS